MSLIFVIEDDATVSRAISILLRDAGFETKVFADGAAILRHVQSTSNGHGTPDAIVIDIHLPDINGLVLSKQLRDRYGDRIPIIVLSGDTSMETLNSLPHVGATYFFSKPVNSSHLIERLKEWTAVVRNPNDEIRMTNQAQMPQ